MVKVTVISVQTSSRQTHPFKRQVSNVIVAFDTKVEQGESSASTILHFASNKILFSKWANLEISEKLGAGIDRSKERRVGEASS